jgi:hypothetical protein
VAGGGGGGGNRFGGPTEGQNGRGHDPAFHDAGEKYDGSRGQGRQRVPSKHRKAGNRSRQQPKQAGGGGGGGGGRGGGAFLARSLQNYKAPAAEAEELASKATGLKKDGDAYAGELPADAVKSLLSRGRAARVATPRKFRARRAT